MPSFSTLSSNRLATCEEPLQRLFNEVVKDYDCSILEGHRSLEKQTEYFNTGKSKTMKSNHLYSPSRAVDVMPYPIRWEDREGQQDFSRFVKAKAAELGIDVRWGGDFRITLQGKEVPFYDSPHWEIVKYD